MPHIGSSSFRRRTGYEVIDDAPGTFSASTWHDCRWIIAVGLLGFGVFVVIVALTALSIQSLHHEMATHLRTPDANASIGSEFLNNKFIAMPQISQADIERAYKEAVEEISIEKVQQEEWMNATRENSGRDYKQGDVEEAAHDQNPRSSSVRAYQYLTYNVNDDFKELFAEARVLDRMTQIIAKRFNLDSSGLSDSRVGWHNCSKGEAGGNCSGHYRSFDGTCNNLRHWKWGVAGAAYRRILPPDYGDGISSPRQSSDGSELPSARAVSSKIHMAQKASNDRVHNALMTFWGQFVTHDMSSAASSTRNPPCNCGLSVRNASRCYPIDVSEDPFFSELNVTCLPFIRSQAAARPDCILGPREQVNLISSYLDGSAIYGSKLEEAIELRSLKNGLMKTSRFHGEPLLPVNPSSPSSFCTQASTNKLCFFAGDSRCNENLVLTSFHTVFLREHNRLSAELKDLNPEWTDERLFQEARKIVVAEMQHITYGEYLPKLLGSDAIAAHGVQLETGDLYYDGYSEDVDPTIANEFSTAVFRFGHSMVRGVAKLLNSSDVNFVQLHKGLYTPWRFQESNDTLASLLFGGSQQNALLVSPHYTTELGNRLFQGEGDLHGLDLAAITVQRGRDHGIPSYSEFRRLCGQSPLRSAEDLERLFGNLLAQRFLSLYKTIDEIDLCSGGLAEPHVPGGILGPTFACVVGDQFSRLRRGDRFWYENGLETSGKAQFTQQQLSEIRKTSLARVICDNVPEIKNIQPNVFLTKSSTNAPVSCSGSSKIPRLSIAHWYDHTRGTSRSAN